MAGERNSEGEAQSRLVALRFNLSGEGHHQLAQKLKKSEEEGSRFSFDFETSAFLFDPDLAKRLLDEFEAEDVTDIYEELITGDYGYRVVRVGSPYTEEPFKGQRNYAMVIKDYATGDFTVFGEDGRFQGIIPAEYTGIVYSPSRFVTVLEKPPQFFETQEAVKVAREQVIQSSTM